MSMQEIWQWVHSCYGDELGLTSDDDDYIPPTMNSRLSDESKINKPYSEFSSEVRLTKYVCIERKSFIKSYCVSGITHV